jgi:hypothetical protein
MKILKIEGGKGYFFDQKEWKEIDKIDKEGLLGLLNVFLDKTIEIDEYDAALLSNQAQQIIYKNIYEKFNGLKDNKNKFKDESDRMYLNEIQKYQQE